MKRPFYWLLILGALFIAACSSVGAPVEPPVAENDESDTAVSSSSSSSEANERFAADRYAEYEIVTLLPRDAIPAIDNPQFLDADDADEKYDPEELIIGVEFNGDARAYSVPFLSGHEIVNDTVGGEKIAVTW